MASVLDQRVNAVRAFNRFWTTIIGVLNAGLLGTPYTLTEARVLFELGRRDLVDLVELRRELAIDAAYLSRIMSRFRADGLAESQPSDRDGRRVSARLTAQGRTVFETLDQRSATEVRALLERLPDESQRRLVQAITTVQQLIEGSPRPPLVVLRPLRAGDLGWVVQRHGALYAQEYGWDETFEGLVARIVADYAEEHDERREHAWIAELDGEPVGCVFCVRKADDVAQLRILLVEPAARGLGIGTRLVTECVDFARRAGYRQMVLWTNDVLVDARRIYERAGFRLVAEEPHHSFGHDLVGQYWALDL
jgi:DNA-binding MarR family transcriptional regulator/GNAT superfamily N-acetyltransferase